MARGRFISDSVAKDARLNSLTVEAELVYLMTIPHLDRDGLIEGDPDVLWGTVCPKRRQFLDTMAVYIQEWAKAGLVTMYDSDEGPVLWFHGFAKNQVGLRYDREGVSKFPPPPGFIRNNSGMAPAESQPNDEKPETDDDYTSADELRQNSSNSTAQYKDQVKDQVKDKSSPPTPPSGENQADDEDAEIRQTRALTAKLHSVGVAVTPHIVDSYSEDIGSYGLEAVLRGITSAADNGKQQYMGYVRKCIITASQGKQNINHSKQTKGMSSLQRLAANNGVQL